jgi:hypothetical protein
VTILVATVVLRVLCDIFRRDLEKNFKRTVTGSSPWMTAGKITLSSVHDEVRVIIGDLLLFHILDMQRAYPTQHSVCAVFSDVDEGISLRRLSHKL